MPKPRTISWFDVLMFMETAYLQERWVAGSHAWRRSQPQYHSWQHKQLAAPGSSSTADSSPTSAPHVCNGKGEASVNQAEAGGAEVRVIGSLVAAGQDKEGSAEVMTVPAEAGGTVALHAHPPLPAPRN